MGAGQAQLAGDYHLLFPARAERLERLCALAGPPPARILELGCGTGESVAALEREGYQAHGIELDPARHAAGLRRHPQLAGKLLHADLLEAVDSLRGPFTLVYGAGHVLPSLGCLDDIAQGISQMLDLARPAGRVLVALPNFDHLAMEAQRVMKLSASRTGGAPADGEELHYIELLDSAPQAGSPQLGSVSAGEVRLYLPPQSATRADGSRLDLERCYSAAPEVWGGRMDAAAVELQYTLRVPEGVFRWSVPLLALTALVLRDCLHRAAALCGQEIAAAWRGGWDGRPWSAGAALSVIELAPPA